MEYFLLLFVLVIFLMIKGIIDNRKKWNHVKEYLRENFGQLSEEELSEQKKGELL